MGDLTDCCDKSSPRSWNASAIFDSFLSRWNLIPDGDPIITNSSRLLPLRHGGAPAMLKLATEEEERFGGELMEWGEGDGAARLFGRTDGRP